MRASNVNARSSTGPVAPGFEAVRNKLDSFLLGDPTLSVQLAAYWRGSLVLDLTGGPDLDSDSVTGVFSSTKGIAAIVVGILLERGVLNLDATVASYWPAFAKAGKSEITVRDLLSHRAGLVGVQGGLTTEELLDCAVGGDRLANEYPLWRPGTAFGYHGITIGILMEELVRQATDQRLQDIYEQEVRAPRDLDFYLGLPASEEHRYRAVLPMAPTPDQVVELASRDAHPDGLPALAFGLSQTPSAGAAPIDPTWPNDRRIREAGVSAFGGVGSARGLASAYAATITNLNGTRLLSETTVTAMSQLHSWGIDRVLEIPSAFGIVFMRPHPAKNFGSYRAFGHDGAGGSIAFADPLHDLGFAYIPNPAQFPGAADPKGLALSSLVRECIARLNNGQ